MSHAGFLKFPHTPHLAWLGASPPRDDKVLARDDADAFLAGEIVVEEKIDGANIGISCDTNLELRVQGRGSWIGRDERGQFSRLWTWLDAHSDALVDALGQEKIVFGEWCYARHSAKYDDLPDWFLAFDVQERDTGQFWSVTRRHTLAVVAGLAEVPILAQGRFSQEQLMDLLEGQSRLGGGKLEGLYLRRETDACLLSRAKLVRADFAQAIGEHWRHRPIEPNKLGLMRELAEIPHP